MTKICSLISSEPNDQVSVLIEKMYDASWQSCYRDREVWSKDRVGLGHFNIGAVNTEQQPIIDSVSGKTSVFGGKIFDSEAFYFG